MAPRHWELQGLRKLDPGFGLGAYGSAVSELEYDAFC